MRKYDGVSRPPDAASIINRLNWLRGVSATAMAILVCLTIFYFFIAPNNSPSLAEFFHDGFSRGNRPAELLSFYWKKFSTLPEVFFFGGPGPLRVAALWLTIKAAWTAAHVDEDWNREKWGADDEVEARRASRLLDFEAAALVLW